ncbi:hypothetical protein KCTC52924_00046 [Arenibacter antarcticus]|uniref:DUF4337 family protein n=1 Tax=Arenibacter antarcticus TaxID=2040469 RepID=A0ABW5VNT6_9FLAO|nr:DUF4337 family protein [Arenibacter sp. H213]MCM4169184.1 DUF4337 domain-containing protein [Arenibacter sp. H213]
MNNPLATRSKNIGVFKSKETAAALLIVISAALMAITELTNNKLEEQMTRSQNQQISYSNWYQAKSIKQNLKESELDFLKALMEIGIVPPEKQQNFKNIMAHTKSMAIKYEAEKTELLVGSSSIPREYWAQDLDGEMGQIIGVKEWITMTQKYNAATQKMDLGQLLFQICIVFSVVCIMIRNNEKLQSNFIGLTILFGILGIIAASYGYLLGL